MKRKILIAAAVAGLIFPLQSNAEEVYREPVRMEATAYDYGKLTAAGVPVREGICAGKREWIGKTAVIYNNQMELIGIYEILDTGGDERIRNGTCLDIYIPDEQRCKEWGRQTVYVQILEAAG